MEAFQLAKCLGMVGAAVEHVDTQLHEPDGEGRKGMSGVLGSAAVVVPGRTVVHEHGQRQALAPKDVGEPVLDRISLLVGTGLQRQVEAGMVVQEGKRMAAVVLHGNVPL